MIKKITVGLLFLSMVALFCSCQNSQSNISEPIITELSGNTQGTTFYIKYLNKELIGVSDSVKNILDEIDRCFSLWRDDSELVTMNKMKNHFYLLNDPKRYFREVLEYSEDIYTKTHGAFNPALHPLISSWGFGRKKGIAPDQNQIDSLLKLTNYGDWKYEAMSSEKPGIKIKTGKGSLDFNAIAQGYTVDVLGRFLKNNGIDDFFIEVGGETLTSGLKHGGNKWVIAIDKPIENLSERTAQDTVYLTNKALVTSGSYRKYVEIDGKKYSHTLNPETGYPSRNQLLSVSVIMDDCAGADAYATAFMVMGKEKTISFLEKHQFISGVYLIYEEDGELKTYISEGFKPFLRP